MKLRFAMELDFGDLGYHWVDIVYNEYRYNEGLFKSGPPLVYWNGHEVGRYIRRAIVERIHEEAVSVLNRMGM